MVASRFELQFEKNPWSCKIIRDGEILLHLSTSYKTSDSGIEKDQYKFNFEDSSLLIQIKGTKVSFKWQGKAIQTQFPLTGYWYGGGELINQPLLWNQIMFPLTEFITCDNGQTGLSTALSPTWLSSLGISLTVTSSFSVGINQPPANYFIWQKWMSIDLIPFNQRPFIDLNGDGDGDGKFSLVGDDLEFDITVEDNILESYRSFVQERGVPQKTPPLELMGAPIWTTWARYKDKIDQDTVLQFASEIIDNGYPYHVLEIDDRWQTHYGDLEFDPERFPAPEEMIQNLHEMGFKVTAWVIPFFHPHSIFGQEGSKAGYFAKYRSGEPCLVKWWQGKGYLLDVTNLDALAWFKDKLDRFKTEMGLDGYKFDAGEGKYAPVDAVFHQALNSGNEYTQRYVKWISENYSFCEVRSAWNNQTSPIFFRLWDLWSTWGYDNGLRSIIPSTLAMSLAGYSFVFPDMIGGNAYFTFPRNPFLNWILQRIVVPTLERKLKSQSEFPEDETLGLADVPPFLEKSTLFGYPTPELMIRWAQANVFLEVMQFSLAPWDFGEECSEICRKCAELHLEFLPTLQKFAREAVKTGEPIIRPVFWLAPSDEQALTCDDQFLVGDEILVAPVLFPKQTTREVYFPPGVWRDHWSGELFSGPSVVENYPAPLNKLPFFIKDEQSTRTNCERENPNLPLIRT
jgi:myogenesis-regulating glycosidase